MQVMSNNLLPYAIDPYALAYAFEVDSFAGTGNWSDLQSVTTALEAHPVGCAFARILRQYEDGLRRGELKKARYLGRFIASILREKAKQLDVDKPRALFPPRRYFLFASPVQMRGEVAEVLKSSTDILAPEIDYLKRYQTLDLIGQSANYDLWLAFDPLLKDIVVIKALSPTSPELSNAARLLDAEYESGRRIDHPGVIGCLDRGEDFALAAGGREEQGRRPYLVMEYLGRMHLQGLFEKREKLLNWEEAREIFLQLLAALEAVHQAGFIHCDIKPQNVIVAELGVKIAVKLIDFGFAVEKGRPVEWGTPHYLSPEQICCKPVDARSDIYGVGVMLFQMLTGSLPFTAETKYRLFQLHLSQLPPGFEQIHPGLQLPADVEKIVRKALNKKPEDRFQSAAEMAEAICSLPLDGGGLGRG